MTITTATLTEALPIIDHLRLRPLQKHPFTLFGDGDIELLITGIGPLNAAVAVSHHIVSHSPLLNIGICAGNQIGQLYNIYKVIDDASAKSYMLQKNQTLPNAKLRTLYRPAKRSYPELVDMEAAGIVVASRRLTLRPTILKIVSDRYDPTSISQHKVTALVETNLKAILDIIANLKKETE